MGALIVLVVFFIALLKALGVPIGLADIWLIVGLSGAMLMGVGLSLWPFKK